MICMFSSLNRLQPLRWYGEIPAITSLRCNHLLGSETEDPYGATLILHRELDRLAEAQVTLKPVVDAGSRDDGAALELIVFLLDPPPPPPPPPAPPALPAAAATPARRAPPRLTFAPPNRPAAPRPPPPPLLPLHAPPPTPQPRLAH